MSNYNPEYTLEYYLNISKNEQQETNGFIFGVPGTSQQLKGVKLGNKIVLIDQLNGEIVDI